jgi:hypothetical protein
MSRSALKWTLIGLLVLVSGPGCATVGRIFHSAQNANPAVEPNVQPQPNVPDVGNQPGQNLENGEYNLAGTWESATDTGFGTTMYTELILEYTGTFSQQVTVADLLTYDTGEYFVGEDFIRFEVKNHEPKEYKGQPLNWLTGFTYYYTFIDEDTLQLEDKISGNTWLAYRKTP